MKQIIGVHNENQIQKSYMLFTNYNVDNELV